MGKIKALFQRPPGEYLPFQVGDSTFMPTGHYGPQPEPTVALRLKWARRNLRSLIGTSSKH